MPKERSADTFDSFKGKVVKITREPSGLMKEDGNPDGKEKFHIEIEPLNVKIEGKTGKMHEWIPISEKTTEDTFVIGSVLHGFYQELKYAVPESKDKELINDSMATMKDKCLEFRKKKLGKSFIDKSGKSREAKDYWVPVQSVNEKEARKELNK